MLEVVDELGGLQRRVVLAVDGRDSGSEDRSWAGPCSTSDSRSRSPPRCGSPTCACTVFSWQPPASIVAARSLSPPPPARKTTPRTIASADQSRRREDVEQAAPLRRRAGRTASNAAAAPAGVSGGWERDLSWPSASDRTDSMSPHRGNRGAVRRRLYRSSARWSFSLSSSVSSSAPSACGSYASRRSGVGRARARRHARRARRRAPFVRREGRDRGSGGVRRRVSGEQLGVSGDRGVEADGLRQAAEGVAREGGRPGADARAGPRTGVRRARRAALAAERAHGVARNRSPDAACPWPLGRDPAQARRRAGGHAAVLRLRRAGDGHHRRRAGCVPI